VPSADPSLAYRYSRLSCSPRPAAIVSLSEAPDDDFGSEGRSILTAVPVLLLSIETVPFACLTKP